MVDISVVREKGGTQEALKKLFEVGPKSGKNNDKLRPLYDRILARLEEGISYNIRNYRLYYALDLAYNAPLRQTAQTLLWSLIDKKADTNEVKAALTDWGLTHLVHQSPDKKTIDLPVFFNILIPLCRAYLTIRWARITNDRKNYPFLKYDPQKQTKDNRVKAEVITDRVQLITQQYDYFSVLKQAVFQMLHYGQAFQFPIESWHSEQQLVREDGKVKETCVREGIRYHTPHPSRTFVDLAHRPCTINSDSGVRFLGYWSIKRWREIEACKDYWNLDKISLGRADWTTLHPTFFNTVYPCNIKVATPANINTPGILDREKEVGFYSRDLGDMGVVLTEYFEKLNPKKENLFDYDYDIWMRFVVASDDTIIFAEPLPYAPAIYYGYDANENQSMNSSLTLEILPAQDHVSNLLTQYILSAKQNLANLNLLDKDALDLDDSTGNSLLTELRNWGEKWYRDLNFRLFSSRKTKMNQAEIGKAVQSFRFTPLPTDGIAGSIRQILDLLERTLVMSAQEVAASASHEQTAEEIRVTTGATSTRLEFTATPVDQAIYAWKKQLYEGLQAYGEEEFYAQLSHKVDEAKLKELGLTVESKWDNESRRMMVKATKTAVSMESFASTRDGEDRINSAAMADSMSKVLGFLLGNERLLQAIGDDQALSLINEINEYLGLPDDFKLRNVAGGLPPQQQLIQLLEQMQQQILKQVGDGIKPVADSVIGVEQNLQAIAAQTQANSVQITKQAALTAQLAKIVHLASVGPQAPPIDPASVQPPLNGGPPGAPGMVAPPGVPPA